MSLNHLETKRYTTTDLVMVVIKVKIYLSKG